MQRLAIGTRVRDARAVIGHALCLRIRVEAPLRQPSAPAFHLKPKSTRHVVTASSSFRPLQSTFRSLSCNSPKPLHRNQ